MRNQQFSISFLDHFNIHYSISILFPELLFPCFSAFGFSTENRKKSFMFYLITSGCIYNFFFSSTSRYITQPDTISIISPRRQNTHKVAVNRNKFKSFMHLLFSRGRVTGETVSTGTVSRNRNRYSAAWPGRPENM